VINGLQPYQALLGPARQVQSYYGSLPAAKRFEITQCKGELQLTEGMVRTGNGKIPCWGDSQQQEESFRRATQIDLPNGVNIAGTRSYQHRQLQDGFEVLTNPA